jgi:hypothetical protein
VPHDLGVTESPVCPVCGIAMPTVAHRGRPATFCSTACRQKSRRDRDEQRIALKNEFADRLRSSISRSEYSLREIVAKLSASNAFLSVGSLSAWQQGRTIPMNTHYTRMTLLLLERILELDAGDLLLALNQTGRSSIGDARPRPNSDILEFRRSEVLAMAGYDNSGQILVEFDYSLQIGHDRRPQQEVVAIRTRAVRDKVAGYWFVSSIDPKAMKELSPLSGCRLGEVLRSGTQQGQESVVAFELIFSRPLQAGEYTDFRFSVRNSYAPDNIKIPDPYFRYAVTTPSFRRLGLRVEFRQLPRDLYQCVWSPGRSVEDHHSSTPQPCLDHHGSALDLYSPTPNSYGWKWQWPAADEAVIQT